jgi:hypothetical protein
MLGFKRFDHAAIVIAGIELARKITKGQFQLQRPSSAPVKSSALAAALCA